MVKSLIFCVALLIAWILPTIKLAASAPESRVWEILSIGYDVPVVEVTALGNRTETSTSNYDTAPIRDASTERMPTEANRASFGQNPKFKVAEREGAITGESEAATSSSLEAGAASETEIEVGSGAAGEAGGIAAEGGGDAFASYMNQVKALDVSTAENGAVFYSGPGNRALAEQFATTNGRTTLEMTPGGQWLDQQQLFGPNSPLTSDQAVQVWSQLSQRFASGASGNAIGFVNGARAGSIFNTVEYPHYLKTRV